MTHTCFFEMNEIGFICNLSSKNLIYITYYNIYNKFGADEVFICMMKYKSQYAHPGYPL